MQLVKLNMKEKMVEVNEEAISVLQKNLQAVSAHTERVAIVSVMGAFRTGKSFVLDLFLRKLRYEQKIAGSAPAAPVPRAEAAQRGGEEEFPLPEWILEGGDKVEGHNTDTDSSGFRFKGGMDHCTQGIWVWSEPFLREVDGQVVALLLMDTQGAWGNDMAKEQSAVVFGLTAVISSKQIYNISMQIDSSKVDNLAYFMNFAQDALHRVNEGGRNSNAKPFQSLDFLVRDWANFEDEWTLDRCKEQMQEHLGKHTDPEQVVDNDTAVTMQGMFGRINCFCLPHPGLKITKQAWGGNVKDVSTDFVRFLDDYVQEVFTTGLEVKTLMGAELTATSFPFVLREFTKAFHDATPMAMSFSQAMTSATVLMAKDKFLKSYRFKMDKEAKQHPRGVEPEEFVKLQRDTSGEIKQQYESATILGSEQVRTDTWQEISDEISKLSEKYRQDNDRRLDQVLVAFANIAILGGTLFIADRVSDWTCDWWSQKCRHASSVMAAVYFFIFMYIGFFVWRLSSKRGMTATASCGAELWKEMIRLSGNYSDQAMKLRSSDVAAFAKRSSAATKAFVANIGGGKAKKE